LGYYQENFRQIIVTRERLSAELRELGFEVFPSETNFILARPPVFPAERWLAELRSRKVLVRWFKQPGVRNYLRITIGTPREADALIRAAERILRAH
jgi:histidinol-phosphate aminotransferase